MNRPHTRAGIAFIVLCVAAGLALAVLTRARPDDSAIAQPVVVEPQTVSAMSEDQLVEANREASEAPFEPIAEPVGHEGAWLAGSWDTGAEEPCEGDSGLTFLADGTWSSYSEKGSWSLEESHLVIEATHSTGIDTASGVPEPLAEQRTEAGSITNVTDESFMWAKADGSSLTFYRCA